MALKLIRDKYINIIPENELDVVQDIIERKYYMNKKLEEELLELKQSNYKDPAEYADVMEVLYALAQLNNIASDQLDKVRLDKLEEKGGFENGILLLEDDDN